VKRLLFATGNAGKLRELEAMLEGHAVVVSSKEFPKVKAPEETGQTFVENARLKAMHYARATGLISLADDSGLCVDALGGRPGVHSARYAHGTDADRVAKLLLELSSVPAPRAASFVCALALASPGGALRVEVGECKGEIVASPRGSSGFGYDPVFYIPALGKTFAELTLEEKGTVSHRAAAMARMRPHLVEILAE
jgi:XTP/dITP diphosphohydrolase